MASILAALLILLVAAGICGALIWRSRAAGRFSDNGSVGSETPRELPEVANDYLAAVDSQLAMPDWLRAEIRAELSDHLADSIEAIEAEGVEADSAAREALVRLGSPGDLARQMSRAHQTPRRLLAGAAGGLVQAGSGFVYGWFVGAFLLLVAYVLAALLLNGLLKAPVAAVAGLLPRFSTDDRDLALNSVHMAAAMCIAAAVSAHSGVRAFADASRRAPARVAPYWAAAGVAVLALLVLFVVDAQQSWLAVLVESLIPVAFAAGALSRIDRGIRIPVGLVAAATIATVLLGALPFFMVTSVSGETQSSDVALEITPLVRQYDRVAPEWQATEPTTQRQDGTNCCAGVDVESVAFDPDFIAQFHGFQFEAWRAVPWSGMPAGSDYTLYEVDAAYSSPFLVADAIPSDGQLTARLDLGHSRNLNWLVFLTATGPDGLRYRLTPMPDEFQSTFGGTVWDWLTASS